MCLLVGSSFACLLKRSLGRAAARPLLYFRRGLECLLGLHQGDIHGTAPGSIGEEVVASEELREPKAFANTAAAVNVISNSVVEEPSFEAPIIIDLTSGLEEEVLVTGDQPQIITFRSPQPVSNLGPVQKSNEVVSFTPLQQLDNISFEPFEVRA